MKELMEEHSIRPGMHETTLLFRIDGAMQRAMDKLADRIQIFWSRRHPPGDYEPDFGERLRRLEEQGGGDPEPRIRIDRYDEGGGRHSWKDWILGLVALLIVAWLGKISLQMDKLTEVVVKQSQDEQRLDRIENHVFKGNP